MMKCCIYKVTILSFLQIGLEIILLVKMQNKKKSYIQLTLIKTVCHPSCCKKIPLNSLCLKVWVFNVFITELEKLQCALHGTAFEDHMEPSHLEKVKLNQVSPTTIHQ